MATIYDVARAAGVTAATVSVALSGRGVVNTKTRERILRCAQEIGYRPNLVARSLAMRRTRTIGLIVPEITNPFYAEVASAVERSAQSAGYHVVFATTSHDPALGRQPLEDLAARQVDGIIAMPGGLDAGAVRTLAATGIPIVPCLWDEEVGPGLSPAVGVDFAAGGRLVADHLLDLGHRRIAVLGVRLPHEGGIRAREVAFRDRIVERGHLFDDALWIWAYHDVDTAHTAAIDLLALPHPPTAVYATNDLMAMGVVAAARECGMRVPDDLSVVGFDDIQLARYVTPPLTTVRIEKAALMALATQLLLQLIQGEMPPSPSPLVPSLIVRKSTAAPRDHGKEGR